MDTDEIKEIIFDRAELERAERIHCENCFENEIFILSDGEHEFSVGLSTILECLLFAIRRGDLPKLPHSWLYDVINMDDSEDLTYNDSFRVGKDRKGEIFQNRGVKEGEDV